MGLNSNFENFKTGLAVLVLLFFSQDIFDFVCFLFDFASNIVEMFDFRSGEASFECVGVIFFVRNPNSLKKIINLNKRNVRFY